MNLGTQPPPRVVTRTMAPRLPLGPATRTKPVFPVSGEDGGLNDDALLWTEDDDDDNDEEIEEDDDGPRDASRTEDDWETEADDGIDDMMSEEARIGGRRFDVFKEGDIEDNNVHGIKESADNIEVELEEEEDEEEVMELE